MFLTNKHLISNSSISDKAQGLSDLSILSQVTDHPICTDSMYAMEGSASLDCAVEEVNFRHVNEVLFEKWDFEKKVMKRKIELLEELLEVEKKKRRSND